MSENTKIVEKWIDYINRKNFSDYGDVFNDDGYVTYGGGDLGIARGPEANGKLIEKFSSAIPDLHTTIEELFDADEGRAVGRFLTRGTHTGSFMGIPASGNKIAINGVAIYRFANGKIAHEWNMDDLLGLMQQIGAVPKPN